MISNNHPYLIFFIVLISFAGCQTEINIDLNSSNPRYVIEADLNDCLGDSKVKITRTLNFNQPNVFPPVSNALVTIKDNDSNQLDTLFEGSRLGIYSKVGLKGFSGHSYTLNVQVDGKLFTSTSVMPTSISLDSIVQLANPTTSGGPGSGPGSGGGPLNKLTTGEVTSPTVSITPYFKDAEHVPNAYQIMVSRNDTVLKDIVLRNDINFSGVYQSLKVQAKVKDSVRIDLQCIDPLAYNYLLDATANLAQSGATPANPNSNISNGALGYFKVHSSSKKSILIK